MSFDEEANITFDASLTKTKELVDELVDEIKITVNEHLRLQAEVKRLLKIIDNRDHDIACLNSELRTALDDNAGLKDEIDELKRKLR